jgi:hypothetical protein
MAGVQHKGQEMDINEFEKRMQPRAKRSKLEPFQAQIFELKAKGYANWQVCEWLLENGVKVSQEGLRKFIKSRDGSAPPSMPSANTAPASAAPKVSPVSPDVPEAGEKTEGLTLGQQRIEREATAAKYIKDSNPILDRLKKESSK